MRIEVSNQWVQGIYQDDYVRMEFDECRLLKKVLPSLKKVLTACEKKLDHFQGIHECGDATSKQQDRLIYYQSQVDTVKGMVSFIQKI